MCLARLQLCHKGSLTTFAVDAFHWGRVSDEIPKGPQSSLCLHVLGGPTFFRRRKDSEQNSSTHTNAERTTPGRAWAGHPLLSTLVKENISTVVSVKCIFNCLVCTSMTFCTTKAEFWNENVKYSALFAVVWSFHSSVQEKCHGSCITERPFHAPDFPCREASGDRGLTLPSIQPPASTAGEMQTWFWKSLSRIAKAVQWLVHAYLPPHCSPGTWPQSSDGKPSSPYGNTVSCFT